MNPRTRSYSTPEAYQTSDFDGLRAALKADARKSRVRRRIIMTIAYITWYSLWALLASLILLLLFR